MRHSLCAAIFAAMLVGGFGLPRCSGQDTESRRSRIKLRSAPDESSAELAKIRDGSEAFVAAFNQGDAKAIAALWTENGDYTDESGVTFSGREAIEREYAQFFAAQPGHKIRLVIDSLKLLSDGAALEDGRAMLEPVPTGDPATSKYTAVHVKVDGQWLMSTVRDSRVESTSAYNHVADLEWLIGQWAAEEHGTRTESVCRWVAGKSFVEREYTATRVDGSTTSGVQLIGWNPLGGHVQSWSFTSDGGHATGIWTPHNGGWTSEVRGYTNDGTLTTATNRLTKLDDNAYVWQSVNRTAGGAPLPDTDEVVIKRRNK